MTKVCLCHLSLRQYISSIYSIIASVGSCENNFQPNTRFDELAKEQHSTQLALSIETILSILIQIFCRKKCEMKVNKIQSNNCIEFRRWNFQPIAVMEMCWRWKKKRIVRQTREEKKNCHLFWFGKSRQKLYKNECDGIVTSEINLLYVDYYVWLYTNQPNYCQYQRKTVRKAINNNTQLDRHQNTIFIPMTQLFRQ